MSSLLGWSLNPDETFAYRLYPFVYGVEDTFVRESAINEVWVARARAGVPNGEI